MIFASRCFTSVSSNVRRFGWDCIEWFYALVSGKLVKPENVYVKCTRCGKLCNKGCDRKPCGRNEVKHG